MQFLKKMLKKLWKISPQYLRLFVLKALCLIFIKQKQTANPCEPIFVIGAFASISGLGQSARLYANAKKRAGINVISIDATAAMVQSNDSDALKSDAISIAKARLMHQAGTLVIHANPPQFQLVLCALGRSFLKNKYIIACWVWELDVFPSSWIHALDYVNSIQVPSSFIKNALSQHTTKSVAVVPYNVAQQQQKETYAHAGIIRCLYSFDLGSSYERKNPLAVLKAFSLAFQTGEAELTFKVSSALTESKNFTILENACKAVHGVKIIQGILSESELETLYLSHDVYISLHRSEGYGLTIKEAMLYGLYVVATGWSGNMDFMQGEKVYVVPYKLIPTGLKEGPAKGLKTKWADANVHEAAKMLKEIRMKLLQTGNN